MFTKFLFAAAISAAALASPAAAALIVNSSTIGQPIVVAATGNVTARYEGSEAGYTNNLFLEGRSGAIFGNGFSHIGDLVDLGTFAAGTELVFRLHVNNTGDDFFSGAASANADGIAHAAASGDSSLTFVGFEDLRGGGDRDYNDLEFSLVNTPAPTIAPGVPEPANWAMMIAGFGMVGGTMRIRTRKASFKAA